MAGHGQDYMMNLTVPSKGYSNPKSVIVPKNKKVRKVVDSINVDTAKDNNNDGGGVVEESEIEQSFVQVSEKALSALSLPDNYENS